MIQVLIISLVLMSHVYCQIPGSSEHAYEMTADEIDCSQETRKCIAKKNARVSTGAKDQLKVLTAERLVASMQEEGKTSYAAPQIIDAEGNVLLKAQGGNTIQSIRADKARYEPYSQKAVFKGNVLVRFGSHVFRGNEVVAELGQGNFTLRGSQQSPVSGLIYLDTLSKNRHRT